MRIIGGEYRGRVLKMPKGVRVRPTQDRVREAIFNIIRLEVPESKVLDLYAGSGAFGIESLSRGALMSIFIDNNINCVKTIKTNVSLLGAKAKFAQVFKIDAVKAIAGFEKEGAKFDIIFMDPPYYKDPFGRLRSIRKPAIPAESMAKNSLLKIDACDILSKRGFVITEHFAKDCMPRDTERLIRFSQRRYGDTAVSFYRMRNTGGEK